MNTNTQTALRNFIHFFLLSKWNISNDGCSLLLSRIYYFLTFFSSHFCRSFFLKDLYNIRLFQVKKWKQKWYSMRNEIISYESTKAEIGMLVGEDEDVFCLHYESNIINLTFWYDKSFVSIHHPANHLLVLSVVRAHISVGWFDLLGYSRPYLRLICANLRMYFDKSSFSIVTFSLVALLFFSPQPIGIIIFRRFHGKLIHQNPLARWWCLDKLLFVRSFVCLFGISKLHYEMKWNEENSARWK